MVPPILILGIETSCDETGVAIYHSEHGLIAQELFSQIDLHAKYGGVVPELASRDHVRKLLPLIISVLDQAKINKKNLSAIAYTAGPGLIGALFVGASLASGLAFALNIPAIPIHHLEAHLLAPMLENNPPTFPFIALLVSGGHTQLIWVKAFGDYKILGESLDDAAGEAFDKTAKLLGLPYPGGPHLAKLAESGDPTKFNFPRPMIHKPDLNFSFSGLKTAVLQVIKTVEAEVSSQKSQVPWGDLEGTPSCSQSIALLRTMETPPSKPSQCSTIDNEKSDLPENIKQDIAASFQEAVVDTLVHKCLAALKQTNLNKLVIAGGVSANQRLREKLTSALKKINAEIFYPRLSFCTDNGAMIAYTGYLKYKVNKIQSDLIIHAKARWEL